MTTTYPSIGGFLLFTMKLMLVVFVLFVLALRATSRATGVMGKL